MSHATSDPLALIPTWFAFFEILDPRRSTEHSDQAQARRKPSQRMCLGLERRSGKAVTPLRSNGDSVSGLKFRHRQRARPACGGCTGLSCRCSDSIIVQAAGSEPAAPSVRHQPIQFEGWKRFQRSLYKNVTAIRRSGHSKADPCANVAAIAVGAPTIQSFLPKLA